MGRMMSKGNGWNGYGCYMSKMGRGNDWGIKRGHLRESDMVRLPWEYSYWDEGRGG